MARYASVAFGLPLDKTFQYEVGPIERDELTVGDLVRAPFGHRRRPQIGCVVSLDRELDPMLAEHPGKLRALLGRATPGYRLSEELVSLARWIAQHYACHWGEALAAVSFVGFNDVGRRTERWLSLRDPEAAGVKLTPKQRLVADHLRATGNVPETSIYLESTCGVGPTVLKRMVAAGALREDHRPPDRPDPYGHDMPRDEPPPLTEDQAAALAPITGALDRGEAMTALLHGVTASGKTEVYLRALAHALGQGRQGIVLVPEIALTPQTVGRFRARFGARVGVAHSRLSLGQKLDLWRRIQAGEIDVVIGARSAVFAPLPRVGLIVLDEEHEGTYKQSSPAPRYHARDVAIVRARALGAVVVLGSATPSLESQANTARGKFTRLKMPRRIGQATLPKVELIDMGEELREGLDDETAPSPLSRRLREALARRLERGEQSIVLLNRRGFAAFVLCTSCRRPVACDHCDVPMTWHERHRGKHRRLVCHWCEATKPLPKTCPACGEPALLPMGLGTQRIEDVLAAEFPQARLLRVDFDTTRGKDAFLTHWRKITAGEVDILLGTQMIAKGLDLPGVTLVGVISADQTLFLPDFRAAERGFQLMTQVAGRAGRADLPGEVLIQTHVPHHYALRFALDHDFEAFFQKEMHIRRVLRFPPAQRLVSLLFTGAAEASVAAAAKRMGQICRNLTHRDEFHERLGVIGPGPAPIARHSDRWRWRLLLRSTSARVLHDALAQARSAHDSKPTPRGVHLAIDVDPLDLM